MVLLSEEEGAKCGNFQKAVMLLEIGEHCIENYFAFRHQRFNDMWYFTAFTVGGYSGNYNVIMFP